MEKLGDNLGANIYILRNRAGLSQEELGFQVGVSRQMISKWELGEAKPRTGNLEKLCEALDVRMTQLLGEEEVLSQEDLIEIVAQIRNEKESQIDINKIRDDLHIIEDIKTEVEKASKENKHKRKKKTRVISIIILLVVVILYVTYSIYKYVILTNINNKVAQYENAENYYCEIEVQENKMRTDHLFIWHKDNKYKIEEYVYNNYETEIIHNVKFIDLEKKEYRRYDYKTNSLLRDDDVIEEAEYNEIKSMYRYFPDIITNKEEAIIKLVFGLNRIYLSHYEDYFDIHINSTEIQINDKTYLPTSYLTEQNRIDKWIYYKIELNNVEDKDVEFNEKDYK